MPGYRRADGGQTRQTGTELPAPPTRQTYNLLRHSGQPDDGLADLPGEGRSQKTTTTAKTD